MTAILQAIVAALSFPNEVLALYNALKTTPEEQHAALVKSIQGEAANLAKGGRPTWS